MQNLVLRLRKTLGPSVIDTRPGGYVLNAAPDSIDVRRFERLVAEGRSRATAGDPTAAGSPVSSRRSLARKPVARARGLATGAV